MDIQGHESIAIHTLANICKEFSSSFDNLPLYSLALERATEDVVRSSNLGFLYNQSVLAVSVRLWATDFAETEVSKTIESADPELLSMLEKPSEFDYTGIVVCLVEFLASSGCRDKKLAERLQTRLDLVPDEASRLGRQIFLIFDAYVYLEENSEGCSEINLDLI